MISPEEGRGPREGPAETPLSGVDPSVPQREAETEDVAADASAEDPDEGVGDLLDLLSDSDVADLLERLEDGLTAESSIGEFELLERIGGGAMGEVWEARQPSLDRTVALKVLRPEVATPRTRRLFDQEARAMARLKHPGIVTVHDTGTAARSGDSEGRMWIAQELIDGRRSLADVLDEQRESVAAGEEQLPDLDRRTVKFFLGIVRAVAYAHSQGVVHRDLKPQNVLVDQHGAPRVADFGLAALKNESSQSTERRLIGTPWYMSPEQVALQAYGTDERSDVFSIGVMLFEALWLERPFDSDEVDDDAARREVFEQIVTRDPRVPDQPHRRVPRKLQAICMRCLEKDRARRYASAHDLGEDLERFLDNRPLRVLADSDSRRAGDSTGEAYSSAAGHPGQYLGHFRLIRFLDRGSQGEVWEAFDTVVERPVALKIVAVEGRSQSQIDRFELEARATARCDHRGIVRIYQSGETHGSLWIAMELIDGVRTLRDLIDEEFGGLEVTVEGHAAFETQRDFESKALFFAELAEALEAVHEQGIVHRDVKPSNILIGADGHARISDFGTARVLDKIGATQAHERVGTPRYMSPEQINPDLYEIDGRSDLFGLGICLYEALSGIHPFEADSAQLVQHKILHERALRLSRIVTRLPPELELILERALEKVRDDRYPSMAAFAADLRAFAEGRPVVADGKPTLRLVRRWILRRKRYVGAAAAVLLAAVVGHEVRAGSAPEFEAGVARGQAQAIEQVAQSLLTDLLAGRVVQLGALAETVGALGATPEAAEIDTTRLLDGRGLAGALDALARFEASAAAPWDLAHASGARAPRLTGVLPVADDSAPDGYAYALSWTSPADPSAGARLHAVEASGAVWLIGVTPLTRLHWAELTDRDPSERFDIGPDLLRERLGWSEAPRELLAGVPFDGTDAERHLRPVLGPFVAR